MFRRVLVPLDGSPLAELAVPHASALARALDADLILLRVLENEPETLRSLFVDSVEWRLTRAQAEAYLSGVAQHIADIPVEWRVVDGRAADEIVLAVHDLDVDVVVLSTHGQGGANDFSVGGTVHKVLLRAGVSVLIARDGIAPGPPFEPVVHRRILVATDCSPRGEAALQLGGALARAQGAALWIAHVVARPAPLPWAPVNRADATHPDRLLIRDRREADRHLQAEAARMAADDLVVHTTVETARHVAEGLNALAQREKIDLIVLCAHGASGPTARPYGSVASALLQFGSPPVLVLQDLPREALRLRARDESEPVAAR